MTSFDSVLANVSKLMIRSEVMTCMNEVATIKCNIYGCLTSVKLNLTRNRYQLFLKR